MIVEPAAVTDAMEILNLQKIRIRAKQSYITIFFIAVKADIAGDAFDFAHKLFLKRS